MNDALVAVINYLDTPSFFNKEQIRSKVNIILNHKDALKEEVELEIKKVEGVNKKEQLDNMANDTVHQQLFGI